MIKAGIIGATGYAGAELVRLLAGHKDVDIVWYGSRSYINDNYMLYKELVNYGFQEGNSEVEDMLRNGGCCLIVYQMADSNIVK